MAGKYKPTLDYEGKVVQSCMHCLQVRDAERRFFRDDKRRMPGEKVPVTVLRDAERMNLELLMQ